MFPSECPQDQNPGLGGDLPPSQLVADEYLRESVVASRNWRRKTQQQQQQQLEC